MTLIYALNEFIDNIQIILQNYTDTILYNDLYIIDNVFFRGWLLGNHVYVKIFLI